MNAIAPTSDPSHYFKAVCYKCGHVGLNAEHTRCSRCSFPIILETGRVTPAREDSIRDIFDRTSVTIGAPPLPGVDAEPRKAQIVAEVRRRRREVVRRATSEALRKRRPSTVSDIVQNPRVRVGFAMLSALVAGFAAAMLNSGM